MDETNFNINEEIIKHFTPKALKQAMDYFNSDKEHELAGYFFKGKQGVFFKPFIDSGNEHDIVITVSEYKGFFESDRLLAFAHSHAKNESILPSQQDLNQVKYSIHDFLIFQADNFEEFIFLGSEHDFSKSFGLVGKTVKVKFNRIS